MRNLSIAVLAFMASAFSGTIDFGPQSVVYANGSELDVMYVSSATFADWDGDGLKDLIVGSMVDTVMAAQYAGHLTLFSNSGTNDSPVFTYSTAMQADGMEIALPGDN
jgi:hypothetical protein